MLRYVQAQFVQAAQSAGCNAKHNMEQRLENRVVGGNAPMKGCQRLEAFAEKAWGTVFVCAIVIALIVVAKPNFPIIQMPQ